MIPRSSLIALAICGLATLLPAQIGDSRPADTAAIELARTIEAKVSGLRGLEFKKPTAVGAYSEDELRDFLKKKVGRSLSSELVTGHVRAMALLGLYARDTDLEAVTLALLGEQVAGFYDPDEKQLFIVKRSAEGMDMAKMDRVIMAHELVHALQDQHFDLVTMLEGLEDNDDLISARKALVEGDATWSMLAFEGGIGAARMSLPMMPDDLATFMQVIERARKMGLGGMLDDGMFSMDALGQTPAVDADEMIFSYYGGAKFCLHLLKKADDPKAVNLERLNAAFSQPPTSTEQVLHPEKYDEDRDDPTALTLPDLTAVLGQGWTKIAENTLGELRLRTLFREAGIEAPRLKRAHSGWDGDRYAVYSKPGQADVLVWATAWDSEKDDLEFAAGIIESFQEKEAPEPGTWLKREDGGRDWTASSFGLSTALSIGAQRGVYVIRQAPTDLAPALLKTLENETEWTDTGTTPEDR